MARGWLPACPFHQLTGWLCPGCGATRALFALLHGHLHTAWAANPLLLLALPGIGGYALAAFRWHRRPSLPPGVTALLLLGTLAFGVGRNLAPPW